MNASAHQRPASDLYAIATEALAKHGIPSQSEQHPHSRLDESEMALVVKQTRIRLGGYSQDGTPVDPGPDIALLGALEGSFATWLDELRFAAQDPQRDQEGLNDGMRRQISHFHSNGGHTSRYTEREYAYILENGLVAFIELQVRRGVFVTIGAVSGLKRNPWTDGGDLFQPFPQFDLRDALVCPDEVANLKTLASQAFLTCRSTVVPSIDHPFIQRQLGETGVAIPEDLSGQPLRRMGEAARAKAVLLGVAQRFGDKFVTSNIGSLFWGDNPEGWANMPSTSFNDWMSPVAFRKAFRIILDERARLRLKLLALVGKIEKGLDALIGSRGIATGKGHDRRDIEAEIRHWSTVVERSIA